MNDVRCQWEETAANCLCAVVVVDVGVHRVNCVLDSVQLPAVVSHDTLQFMCSNVALSINRVVGVNPRIDQTEDADCFQFRVNLKVCRKYDIKYVFLRRGCVVSSVVSVEVNKS